MKYKHETLAEPWNEHLGQIEHRAFAKQPTDEDVYYLLNLVVELGRQLIVARDALKKEGLYFSELEDTLSEVVALDS